MLKKIKFALMKKKIPVLLLISLLFQTCKTDFDVIAPYKEIIVIDGLINAIDTVQYIKVSKAFLGVGNALIMAQQSDSINYADILDVQLEKVSNGPDVIIPLSRTELFNKDSGTFAYPFHVLYKTNVVIDQNAQYRIRVTNRQTGVVATSLTKIVKDMQISTPISCTTSPYCDSIDMATGSNNKYNVVFFPGANSVIFDLIIRFHYREIDPFGNSVPKNVDWNFSDQSSTNTPTEVKFTFSKYELYQVIGANIPDKPGYIRRIDSLSAGLKPVEIICLAGSVDLQTYMQLQAPTTGIVQDRPIFTTVNNGLGLFTSRIVHSIFRYPNAVTQAAFDTSVATRNKNFRFN